MCIRDRYIDSVLVIVAAAQEPDGYLYTSRTMNPKHPHEWAGSKRWEKVEELSHEFYNLGHMVEGAIAHYQATGKRNFLDIAIRYADCVCREIGTGEGQQIRVPGHQIAEMALAKLYLVTGQQKYLDQAKFFLAVSYTHLRAHETRHDLVCRLLLEKKKKGKQELYLSLINMCERKRLSMRSKAGFGLIKNS